MLKNKMKKLICGMTMCITVCSQMIFPQTAFAATKAAVEKAGEAFVAGMTETAEAEEVLSEEELRQQIVDFALQFEGNPYVYGGTSLTNGADCSGFVMSVFAQFGYSLPRVAADQYNQSAKKKRGRSGARRSDFLWKRNQPCGTVHWKWTDYPCKYICVWNQDFQL